MTWDPVPYFVEGGAQHSAEVMRTIAYSLLGGQEGVMGAFDLRALPKNPPGSGIRIMPGNGGILNRATGHDNEEYIIRNPDEENVATNPTTTSGSRSDLIIAQIRNPYLSGEPWQVPADKANGPYIYSDVIQGVPSNTKDVVSLGLGYSAIPVCRLDIPANTATIEQSMIKDLRVVVNPLTGILASAESSAAAQLWSDSKPCPSNAHLTPADSTYRIYPPEASWQISVPEWATEADVFVDIDPYALGNQWGSSKFILGSSQTRDCLFDVNYSSNFGDGGMRCRILTTGSMPINASDRGKLVYASLQMYMHPPQGMVVGDMLCNAGTQLYAQVHFKQGPAMQ